MNSAFTPALGARMWGRSAYQYPGRWLGTGNRCGHNPLKGEFERYQAPSTRRKHPIIIQKLLEGARAYYQAPQLLPTLMNLSGKANQDGNPRCNRSEARAAECLVMEAIIQYTEFASLRVGTPRSDGGFIPRSCAEIARVAGLLAPDSTDEHPEPSTRFWRAFTRLKVAGMFTVTRQYETKPDGSKRARPAIKAVSMQFLVALGRTGYQKLKAFRDRCSNQVKKLRRKHREQFPAEHDAQQARQKLATKQTSETGIEALMQKQRRGRRDMPDANVERERQREYSRAKLDYMNEIMANNPGARDRDVLELVNLKYPPYDVWRSRQ